MDPLRTDTPPRLLLARAAVLAVEERRKTDDADPRSTRPLADAALEERALVLAEVVGQAERRSSTTADPASPSNVTAARALGTASGAAEFDGKEPTGGELARSEPGAAQRGGPVFVRSLAPSSDLYRDDLRMEDGEDGPCDLVRTKLWEDHPTEGF